MCSLQVVIEADQPQSPEDGEAKCQDKTAGAGLAAAKATVASWGQGNPLPRAASPAPPSSWERLQEGKRQQEQQQQGLSAAGAALANRPLNPLFQQAAAGAMDHSQEPLARMKSNPGSPAAVPPTPPPTTCSPIAPRPPGTKPAFRRGSVDSAVGQRALPAPPSHSPQYEEQQQFMTSSPLIKVVNVAGSGGARAVAAAPREPSPPPRSSPSPIGRPQKPTSLLLPQLPSSMTSGSSPPVLYGGGGKGAPLSPTRSFKSFSTSAGVVEAMLPAAAFKPGPDGEASGRSPMASRKNSGKYAAVVAQGIRPLSPPPLAAGAAAAAPGGGSSIRSLNKVRNVSFAKLDGYGSGEAEE